MEIPEALEAAAHFRGLSNEVLGQLAGSFVEQDVDPGEAVYEAGATVDALYVVAAGTVVVFRGSGGPGAQPLARLRAGDVVGVADFFDREKRSETVRATEETVLLRGPKNKLLSFLQRQPQVELTLRLAAAKNLTARAKVSLAVAQRRVVRHRINLDVQLTPAAAEPLPATLIDLSTLGMSFRGAPDSWQRNDLVRYRLAWKGRRLDLAGRVAWRDDQQVGIELENPTSALQAELMETLEQMLRSAA